MKPLLITAGLTALAGLSLAQDVGPAPVAAPAPATVVRPPVVTIDGVTAPPAPDVIVRSRVPGTGSSNVVVGSGNGFGNTVVVDGVPGVSTVVQNSRNGFGNRVIVNGVDLLADFPFAAPAAAPAEPVYRGKATRFWAERAWSEADDCNVYWSAKDRLWFRYHREDDTYRPLPGDPLPPPAVR